jgi:hypothetical protein
MSRYAKLTTWLLGAWFVVTLVASGLHLYQNGPNQPPLPLGLAALTPVIVFLVWFTVSASFRKFTMSLNVRALTVVQTLRIVGYVFLVLASYSILPRVFALSAGWGDIAIGATAPLAAFTLATPTRRRSFIVWQLLGIADLVNAVLLGTLGGVINPHGIPMGAMTVLPLSLIPTFGVPLFLILHVICIAQALRWQGEQIRPVAEQRWSEAL